MQVQNIGFRGMHIRKVACLLALAVPGLHLQVPHPQFTPLPRTAYLSQTCKQTNIHSIQGIHGQGMYNQHLNKTNTGTF